MTKEALKLALKALEQYAEYEGETRAANEAITAIKEALAQPEPNYKKALEVWLDKTEWVQETVKPHELGMHRADVLKQRIKEVLAQPEQDSCYGYKGKCNRVMSDGNPCGLNAPCPDCGLSLIDCPKPQPWEKFCDSNCVWTDHHPDCKLAQPEQGQFALKHRIAELEGAVIGLQAQRTWVGLTDEDIALIDWESLVTKKDCVQAIEAKLKEKNT